MKNTKIQKIIGVTLLLLAVGFALVTTTLYINGKATISENTDFNVIFTKAVLDGSDISDTAIVKPAKKTIEFQTRQLHREHEQAILDFTIFNESRNYDAEISNLVCNIDKNQPGFNYNWLTYVDYGIELFYADASKPYVYAQNTLNGRLTITLTKTADIAFDLHINCSFDASSESRDERADVYIPTTTPATPTSRVTVPLKFLDKDDDDNLVASPLTSLNYVNPAYYDAYDEWVNNGSVGEAPREEDYTSKGSLHDEFMELEYVDIPSESQNVSQYTKIGDYAFKNSNFKVVAIDSEIEEIGVEAFAIPSLEKIYLDSTITNIGNRAFANTINLTVVNYAGVDYTTKDALFAALDSIPGRVTYNKDNIFDGSNFQ